MGLHENANITQAINEANDIFACVLKLTSASQSEGGDGAGSEADFAMKMTQDILAQIREPFKIKEVEKKFPFKYEESMNSVLLQELARFNSLIEVIKETLSTLQKTLEGKLVTNAETEELQQSIVNNAIPEKWRKKSYPSRKPLMAYVADLKKRLEMLDTWIADGQPNVFWISGFFFTHSFLTGVKQNFARANEYPIDRVAFEYRVLQEAEADRAHAVAPDIGA